MISENARQNSINSYVTKATYIINTLLLLYHVFFGFLFYKNQAHYLYYFNYISILTYLVCYFILYKQKSYLYIAVVFLEIYVFMLLSVIGIGWDYGFQQYCFSFVASLLFTDFYMNKRHKLRKTTILFIILNVITYLFMRLWTYKQPYIYVIADTSLIPTFYITNAIITFGFLILYFCIYSNTVLRLEQSLVEAASRDPLTGLRNRRGMQDLLSTVPNTSLPYQMCIAMIDIDNFKKINDTYGHDIGDEVLIALANILLERHTQNQSFHVCRWGGEEFLIFYRKYKKTEQEVYLQFDELRKQIAKTVLHFNDLEISFTITTGLSLYNKNMSIEDMIKQADANLYFGKEHGKNVVIN